MARFIAAIAVRDGLQVPGLVDDRPQGPAPAHVANERDVDIAIAIRQADCKITTIRALDLALLDSVSPPHQPPLVLWLHDARSTRSRSGGNAVTRGKTTSDRSCS